MKPHVEKLNAFFDLFERNCGPKGLARVDIEFLLNLNRSQVGHAITMLKARPSAQGRIFVCGWRDVRNCPGHKGPAVPLYQVAYTDSLRDAPRPKRLTDTERQRRHRENLSERKYREEASRLAAKKSPKLPTTAGQRKATPWDGLLGVKA